MITSAHIRTTHEAGVGLGWAGPHTLTVDRPAANGGSGRGYTGGELLLLAVGACYHNDLHREASRRGIALEQVAVDVRCGWEGQPMRAVDITVDITVTAAADEAEIRALVRDVDAGAAIPATLRLGGAVTLAQVRAASTAQGAGAPEAGGTPEADAVLEMLGTADMPASCAVLTPAIKARLRDMRGGQVLAVRIDDPSARDDIAAWCRLAGHELVAVVAESETTARYLVRKKADSR